MTCAIRPWPFGPSWRADSLVHYFHSGSGAYLELIPAKNLISANLKACCTRFGGGVPRASRSGLRKCLTENFIFFATWVILSFLAHDSSIFTAFLAVSYGGRPPRLLGRRTHVPHPHCVPYASDPMSLAHMEDWVDILVQRDLAPGTRRGTKTMTNSWLTFCVFFDRPHLYALDRDHAVLEQALCTYAVYLTQGSLQYQTVRTCTVVGVGRWHAAVYLPFSTERMIKLGRLLHALKREIPPKLNPRLPMTVPLLVGLAERADPLSAVDCCFMSMCTLLIFGCRRLGEVASATVGSFNPTKHLSRSCIFFEGDVMLAVFPTLKNRPNGPPLVCPIPLVGGAFCAYTWMQRWLSISGIADPLAPVFQRIDRRSGSPTGQPLLKSMFIKHLQAQVKIVDPGAPSECFTGHSFRIAAASILAIFCKAMPHIIKEIGDWSFDCFMKYIQMQAQDKVNTVRELSLVFRSMSLHSPA